MEDKLNKREFTRVPIKMEAEVSSDDTGLTSGEIKDLSMNGIYLVCDEDLAAGTECQVVLFFGEGQGRLRIEVSGKVVRTDDGGVGVEFSEIVGLESFDHLRNIVLHNAQETDEVEKELKEHLGIKRRE